MLKNGMFLLALFLFSSTTVLAGESRIVPPGKDQALRCYETHPSKEACKLERDYALKVGCITQEEFDLLVKYEAYPVCDDNDYVGWCPPGCFIRGTMILVTDKQTGLVKYVPVENIVAHRLQYLVWCMSSSRNGFTFAPHEIKLTTQGHEEEPIVYVHLDNGSQIGLTTEHGVLLANGTVTNARSLKVGDHLVDLDHNEMTVVKIHQENTADLVFNLLVDDAADIKNHFIVAQDIVVGDLAWQGSLSSNLNKFVLEN